VGHGPVGALVSSWPALALVGSFELLMMLVRNGRSTRQVMPSPSPGTSPHHRWCKKPRWNRLRQAWSRRFAHGARRPEWAIARELNIDRRKVKRILDQPA
jgi:hypothetical protein